MQAVDAPDRVAGYDFVASPLERSRETMEIVRTTLGLEPAAYRLDERLREIAFGAWEGFTTDELRALDRRQVAKVLERIGLSVSDAIRLMMIRIAEEKTLPFDLHVPNGETIAAIEEAERGGLPSFDTLRN